MKTFDVSKAHDHDGISFKMITQLTLNSIAVAIIANDWKKATQ